MIVSKVSVIIPNYNAERYIELCLESIKKIKVSWRSLLLMMDQLTVHVKN